MEFSSFQYGPDSLKTCKGIDMDHIVGIQDNQIVKRAKLFECNPEEGINEQQLIPLLEACRTHYPFDAHFFCYFLDTKEEIPALAKNVLTLIRDKNHDLLMEVFALDMDIQGKQLWNEKYFNEFTETYAKIEKDLPPPTIFYTTRHGARFVFALTQPVPVDEGERIHKGLSYLYSKHFNGNLKIDLKCSNWDRVFRCPHVVREGIKTWEEDWFIYHEELTQQLDPLTIKPMGHLQSAPTSSMDLPDIPKPDLSECSLLLYTEKGTMSDFYKEARKFLKGRECYSACFEDKPIAEVGHRNSTIQQFVGSCTAMLIHLPQITPRHIYALLLNSVLLLEPDKDTSDWTEILWQAVLRYWTKEKHRIEIEEENEKNRKLKVQDKLDQIINVMQEWSDHPDLHADTPDIRRDFATSHLIAMTPNEYYIMTETGYYHPIGTGKINELPALIRRYGMDDIIQILEYQNGREALSSGSMILARHGIKVKEMVGKIKAPGIYIENLTSERMVLISNLFSLREDLLRKAKFHPEIDRWLRSLVVPEQYELLESWIGWALAFDEGPICALSLSGPPGCGKKLFCQGLAECLTTGEYATAREFGRFREPLLRTCFLVVDEGLPKPQQGVSDVADTFRHFVSGDPLQIEQKYKTPITIRNPIRIIFTSNNSDVVQELAGHRELTKEDQEALALRILHLEAQQDATNYLLSLGGIHHTTGWISGDSGEKSDYVIARHFLWLYLHKRHDHPKQRRFLVEGALDSDVMSEMKLRSGISPQIIETLINMIEHDTPQILSGLAILNEKGEVWVTNKGVSDRFSGLFPQYRLNGHALRKVLNNITLFQFKGRMDLPKGKKSDNLCWRKIDLHLLLEEAIKNGMDHKKLDRLYQRQLEIKREEDLIKEG